MGRLILALLIALGPWVAQAAPDNRIEVNEQFYVLTFDDDAGTYDRHVVEAAKPGDLVELEIKATNIGDEQAEDVELINTVPTGSARLVAGSITLDDARSEIRLSRDGDTYFPAAVNIPAEDIRFVKWLIYSLAPEASLHLSYRLHIPKAGEPATPETAPDN